ncbi:SDR family NAD(P)-dependent oxidoreductase [Actinomadura verrucosospora]|uniref:Short-chain dehydrogenase/reductase SDR n=1 Tax=Actinomadura verrucosospora TaxID=46165 RepID=A0A7D4A3U8_ACTVE|nr:glucose 1-dehydrogenase [Actinomadura verrucosospora]QKG19707.1 short-chain dehydrogenase/reductase SDR [Actinomadura verrucosospora]
MARLDGKVALITGGARGIGEAHVRRFAAEGARVVFGDLLEDRGAAVAAATGAVFVPMDVTSEEDWRRAVATAVERFGKLNVLVNNAGILRHRLLTDMTREQLQQVLDVNLVGPWLGMRAVVEPMKAAGGGSIVNTSSIEGYAAAAGLSAYAASKFGVRGITKAGAQELGKHGIRVNSIHPGGIATELALDPEVAQGVEVDADAFFKALPIPRWGEPDDVAGAAVYLASDESAYCTGTEILVDGGLLSGPGY